MQDFIGLDAIALPKHFSGAAYYIYNLICALLAADRPFPLAIVCKSRHEHLFEKFLRPEDKLIRVPLKNRLQQLHFYEYQLSGLLIKEGIKLFHATHYITPRPSDFYKIVTTFHDMGFLLYPKYYPRVKNLFFGKRMSTFISRSDILLAVSEATRDSIDTLFPENRSKLEIVYPGVNHFSSGMAKDNRKKYLLAVNSIEKRKNIPFLIRVFNLLKSKYHLEHQFIIIGHHANDYSNVIAEINHSPYKNDIILLNSLSKEELTGYYQNADFFVNASIYEGFGFTPFEAIRFSCPSFIYNNNVIRKVFKEHPYLLKTLDINEWADFIAKELKLNFQNKISQSLIKHFTWENTAQETFGLYSQLMMHREILVA